ncbi:hypothetical protein BU23DRAFT_6576 [Bimuria novae-zelandiae CBS 107.79]|uniref:C2H2-type domain-containing protein n=1 Tax=Bimuria novae-zelandiae CBS 107.79 TaxID=1447943 RepID=A0A6A5VSI7_9PLEO|nr:hypothetical protein BU23DRAFT_6576 [Bimuria novae-zelandiae CBS 107.79]
MQPLNSVAISNLDQKYEEFDFANWDMDQLLNSQTFATPDVTRQSPSHWGKISVLRVIRPTGDRRLFASSRSPFTKRRSTIRKRNFTCPHSPCTRSFTSRNDLERHLAIRKHRQDSGSARVDKYKCNVPFCKRKSDGFSRKDHFSRHMEKVHPDYAPRDNSEILSPDE